MFKESEFNGIKYLLKFPKEYNESKKYPIIIFMHGAGTRGDDIENLKQNPYFLITEKHKDFPFIIVAPLCSTDTWYDRLETVNALAEYISNQAFVERERIYLMGASMGGYATWAMAMSNPSLYAAIVPICGGGMYWNGARLKNTPIWVFHGDIDKTVRLRESELMVEAINANGGNAKLTVYKNCGHDAWSDTYGNPEVFKWLLSHKRNSIKAEHSDFNNSKVYG